MLDLKSLALATLLTPLAAAVFTGVLGRNLSKSWVHTLCIGAVGVASILSCSILTSLVFFQTEALNIHLYTWAVAGDISFQAGLLIDKLTAAMMCIVTFISFMVHIYTVGYMRDDAGYRRFFSYITLFTFGMLVLVTSNNFLQLFFGWEMVGVISYLLIGFWFHKESATVANFKAFIINRIGDFGFILGIAAIAYGFGTLDYARVFSQVETVAVSGQAIMLFNPIAIPIIPFACICLFIGAMGKSAQVPLHVWLPDSMEGPTPISALIHAATMVTAGVFMVARLSALFEHSAFALHFILLIGTLTCLLMGLVALVQNDIKRIIAYSTLSQLGYMMIAMGVSAYPIGIFHLVTHAFFKALLFLGAGSVIMALHHEQNIWQMGDLKKYMPITYITMLIGSLALIGFPPFAGFYSKDLIIEAVKVSTMPGASIAYYIALGSVLITALYTFRLFFVVFHSKATMSVETISHLCEPSLNIRLPLIVLALLSMSAGYLLVGPLLQGYFNGSITINDALHPGFAMLQAHFQGAFAMALQGFWQLPFYLSMAGVLIAWLCYVRYPQLSSHIQKTFPSLNKILNHKFGFDTFYEKIAMQGMSLGRSFWQQWDNKLIDGMGVNGTANAIDHIANRLRQFQTGHLYHYAFFMILGFLLLISWMLLTQPGVK